MDKRVMWIGYMKKVCVIRSYGESCCGLDRWDEVVMDEWVW